MWWIELPAKTVCAQEGFTKMMYHRTFSASLLRGRAILRLQLDPDAL